VLSELAAGDRIVIRALPGSRDAISARLEQELTSALERIRANAGRGKR
jgi:ribonuclease P protein component